MVKNLQRIGLTLRVKTRAEWGGQISKFDITSTDIYRDILHTHMKFLLNLCSKYLPQREPSKVSRALESVQTQEPGAKAEGASKADRGQSTIVYHSV